MIRCFLPLLLFLMLPLTAGATSTVGYYRFPAIHGDTVVFTAEGDLWRVGVEGGVAQRLTTHHGVESHATISPDGTLIAFSAQYEGPTEVYTMPLAGGLPVRRTYAGEGASVVGWTPDGKVLYSTRHYSTLPNTQLVMADVQSGSHAVVPLNQASDGVYGPDGHTLFFSGCLSRGATRSATKAERPRICGGLPRTSRRPFP